jgi:transcriptional regulator with XRE-family HTH domain
MWKKRSVEKRKALSAALKRWRGIAGISQMDLCARVGSAQAQLSRIESGTAGASLGLVLDIAKALNVELMVVPRELCGKVGELVEINARAREMAGPEPSAGGRPRGSVNAKMNGEAKPGCHA